MSDMTELQQDIIEEHREDKSKSDEEIAAKLDCSASYVNQTRNEYGEEDSNSRFWIGVVILALLLLVWGADSGSAMQLSMIVF